MDSLVQGLLNKRENIQNYEKKLDKAIAEGKLKVYDYKQKDDWTGFLFQILPFVLITTQRCETSIPLILELRLEIYRTNSTCYRCFLKIFLLSNLYSQETNFQRWHYFKKILNL